MTNSILGIHLMLWHLRYKEVEYVVISDDPVLVTL